MKLKCWNMKNVQKVCRLLFMSVLAMVFYAQAAGAEYLVDAIVTFPGLTSTETCTDPYVVDYSVPGTGGTVVTKYSVDPFLESYMPAGSRHTVQYQVWENGGWSGWAYGFPYCCGGGSSKYIQNGIEITTQGFVTGIPLYIESIAKQDKGRPIDKVQVAVKPGCGAFSGPLHQDAQEVRLTIEFIPDSDTPAPPASQPSTTTPGVAVTSSTPGGLIGKWSFDGDAKDSSGNGNDGIINGATFVDGKFGKALSFDGVDDSVSIEANLIKKDNTPFSIVSWFKIPSGGGNGNFDTIYATGNCDGSYGFHSYAIGGDRRLYFDKECVGALISGNTQYSLDVWHQGVVVYNGNSARIYLDGVPDSNWVAVANQEGAEANDYIGSIASSYYFKGLIDEVRIYDRVLSEAEIQADMNAGTSPSTSPSTTTTTCFDNGMGASGGNCIYSNGNVGGVYNNPTSPTTFTLTNTYNVMSISTYHYNSGSGAIPGTISLKDSSGKTVGKWTATGRYGNRYWDVTPNINLGPGTYTVIDSDTSTWAQNSETNNQGMFIVKGTLATASAPGVTTQRGTTGDFTVSISPTEMTVDPGENIRFTLTVEPEDNFNEPVEIYVKTEALGIEKDYGRVKIIHPPYQPYVFEKQVPGEIPEGTTITGYVTAKGGGLERDAGTVTVNVPGFEILLAIGALGLVMLFRKRR